MAKEATEKTPCFDVVYLGKNTLFCFLATGGLLLIGAVVATYLSVAERTIDLLVMILTYLCVFGGGFRCAKHVGRQGLVQGGIFGAVYMVVLTLAGLLLGGTWPIPQEVWVSILLGVLCGAIGGMLGVNTKGKTKRKR